MIGAAIEAKAGNYMVFFPSYAYMREVYEAFSTPLSGPADPCFRLPT